MSGRYPYDGGLAERPVRDGLVTDQYQVERLLPLLRGEVVGARWQSSFMSDENWDGRRAVNANSGETRFRVRGNRMVDTNTGETSFRVRDDGRVVDANSGETRFRVRDDGRVVDADTGGTIYRLRG